MTTDVAIVGAGPAGITAAIYALRAGLDVTVFEKNIYGGQTSIIENIENYPGFLKISGPDFSNALYEQAKNFGAKFVFSEVTDVDFSSEEKILKTSSGKTICAKSVIISNGLKRRTLGCIGEKEFFGKGVSYCATCDGPLLKNKVAVIYGNGDRVLEEGLYLANIVKRLYLLCPNETYQGDEALLEKLKEKDNVTYLPSSKILSIQGDFRVTSIRYSSKEEEHVLETNMVFPFAGEKSAVQFLSTLPVIMEKGFIVVDDKNMSNIPGLFAAGDIVKKRLRQVVTAASDGAIASTGILSYLHSLKRNVK